MSINEEQKQEIAQLKQQKFQTSRVTSAAAEKILYEPIEVLDYGFVRLIDYMGDDTAITQAARVSYGKGTKSTRNDSGLIRYLMRHRHTTPFEMVEAKFHIKLPIFVARQWIRHRTANVNEYSARYSVLDKEYYIPKIENVAQQSDINNQGRGQVLSEAQALEVMKILKDDAERNYNHYEDLINDEDAPVARELARINLTLNTYTQWYWKIDLHNLLHFLHLRADSHAQYEIRVYADAILNIVKEWLPITYQAFIDYRANSFQLSSQQIDYIRKRINGEEVNFESSNMSKREWDEMQNILVNK